MVILKKNFSYLWIINLFLIVAIAVFISFKFYKPSVVIDCNYGSKPERLLEIVKKEFKP